MEIVMKLLIVLGLGAVEIWAAVPTGLALGIHPAATGITAAAGAVLGTLVVIVLGSRVQAWLLQRHGRGGEPRQGRIGRIWQRYGVIGLGLLAPLLTGAPLGAALGLTMGASAGRLLLWMSFGVVLWSTVLTLAGVLGIEAVKALWH